MTALALNKLEGLEVHLISRKNKHSKDKRTTAISASNYEFFNEVIDKLRQKVILAFQKNRSFLRNKRSEHEFLKL